MLLFLSLNYQSFDLNHMMVRLNVKLLIKGEKSGKKFNNFLFNFSSKKKNFLFNSITNSQSQMRGYVLMFSNMILYMCVCDRCFPVYTNYRKTLDQIKIRDTNSKNYLRQLKDKNK